MRRELVALGAQFAILLFGLVSLRLDPVQLRKYVRSIHRLTCPSVPAEDLFGVAFGAGEDFVLDLLVNLLFGLLVALLVSLLVARSRRGGYRGRSFCLL